MKVRIGMFLVLMGLVGMGTSVSAHTVATHSVEMNETGFSPAEITVLQGDTVEFKNLDTVERWPASNIHPTHQIYSAFDPKEGIAPGESWSFTFTQAGTWRLHDHLVPEFVGVVTVTEDPDFVAPEETEVDDAEVLGWWEKIRIFFLKTYFKVFPQKATDTLTSLNLFEPDERLLEWMAVFGPDLIMEELLADSSGGTVRDCHQSAHTIGRFAYQLYGAEAFSTGNAHCHSGFYHGAMESFLKERGTAHIAEDITELCSLFDTRFSKFECLHGVGHGVLAYEDYDLPESLAVCKKLGDFFSVNSCYGGVFMENVVTGQGRGATTEHNTSWVSEDPHYPCNVFTDSEVLTQCYQMQTSWMLTLFQYDFDKVIAECQRATPDMVSVCFKSLGRDAAGHSLRDPVKTMAICNKVTDPSRHSQCVEGALNVVVDFWGAALTDQASRFCDAVSIEHRGQCYLLLKNRLPGLFEEKTKIDALCSTFAPAYKNFCAL